MTSVIATETVSSVEEYFFEGAEKLLELWFTETGSGSLRDIPRHKIDSMLDVARCKILHSAHSKGLDSYVLSESSLFISDRRLIMKTCGTTRLLAALPVILELASTFAGLEEVESVYYSRKNFMRPELQPAVHRNFDSEVEYLDSFFEGGQAYCLGSLKSDRWYLYTMHKQMPANRKVTPDGTLEILMTDLHHDVLRLYTREVADDGKHCTKIAGIDQLLPKDMSIHEELFDPCGYSMNAYRDDESDHYATIHVTPEKDFSFASFETNQDSMCLYKQTQKVLRCFRPGKLLMTVFANNISLKGKDAQQQLWERELPGYRRTNVQFIRLQEETLVYAHFTRKNDCFDSSDDDEGSRSD